MSRRFMPLMHHDLEVDRCKCRALHMHIRSHLKPGLSLVISVKSGRAGLVERAQAFMGTSFE